MIVNFCLQTSECDVSCPGSQWTVVLGITMNIGNEFESTIFFILIIKFINGTTMIMVIVCFIVSAFPLVFEKQFLNV